MSVNSERAERAARFAAIEAPSFTPAEQISIRDLRAGDFVESIPAQQGCRASQPMSALTSSVADWERWSQRIGRRGRMSIESRDMRFAAGAHLNVPADFVAIARRIIREG